MHTIDTATPPRPGMSAPAATSLRIAARSVLAILSSVFEILMTWQEKSRQRRQLLALGDDMLKDIGISRADAHYEGSKPFWRT